MNQARFMVLCWKQWKLQFLTQQAGLMPVFSPVGWGKEQ
jgi:hypothetical protein